MYPVGYSNNMNYIIEQTEIFEKWHKSIRDMRARITIARRIDRAEHGNLGDKDGRE